jgi:hypothetical protein
MRLFNARLPVTQSAVMDADNSTHALCLRATGSVPQDAADKLSSLVKGDYQETLGSIPGGTDQPCKNRDRG